MDFISNKSGKTIEEIESHMNSLRKELKHYIFLYFNYPDLISDDWKYLFEIELSPNEMMRLYLFLVHGTDTEVNYTMHPLNKYLNQGLTMIQTIDIIFGTGLVKIKEENSLEDIGIKFDKDTIKLTIAGGVYAFWLVAMNIAFFVAFLFPIIGPFVALLMAAVAGPISILILRKLIKEIVKKVKSSEKRKEIPRDLAVTSLLAKETFKLERQGEQLEKRGLPNPTKNEERMKQVLLKKKKKILEKNPQLNDNISQSEALGYINKANKYVKKRTPEYKNEEVNALLNKKGIKYEISEEDLKKDD